MRKRFYLGFSDFILFNFFVVVVLIRGVVVDLRGDVGNVCRCVLIYGGIRMGKEGEGGINIYCLGLGMFSILKCLLEVE